MNGNDESDVCYKLLVRRESTRLLYIAQNWDNKEEYTHRFGLFFHIFNTVPISLVKTFRNVVHRLDCSCKSMQPHCTPYINRLCTIPNYLVIDVLDLSTWTVWRGLWLICSLEGMIVTSMSRYRCSMFDRIPPSCEGDPVNRDNIFDFVFIQCDGVRLNGGHLERFFVSRL